MYDYSSEVFHVGHLVPDIQVAMDALGSSLGLSWTEVDHRDDQRCGNRERAARSVRGLG